jgi:predicted ATP-grasp superfamily ATP-dependent carboligase
VLASSFIVACSDWNVAQQFIDKALTYDIAEKAGIPIPKTISPRSLTEAKECEEQIVYPCLVKPRQSHLFYEHFKKKSFVAANSEEMIAAFKRASEVGLEVSLQEIIPGSDSLVVNFNCYAIEGVTVAEFTAEHTRNGPPFFGSPRVALSKVIPEVFEPGRRLMKAMNYDGYACTEFKQDPRDGAYKLMEVNGRHNLSTLLAVGCGLNFPYIEYRHRVYGDIPSASNFRHGIYWTDFFRDVGFSVRHRRSEGYTLRQYIDPYLKHHIDAIIDLKDPLPLLGRLQGLALEWARGRL